MSKPARRLSADEQLLRAAARRTAWQIAAAYAIVVVIAGVIALVIGTSVHHHGGDAGHDIGGDHDDDVVRTTLLIAGAFGIAIGGLAGFVIARRAVAPLGDALARQRRFVADAGHELRIPLTVLHTRAQLIARRMKRDDPAAPAVDQLLDDSRVLGQIIEELLTSAQLAADPSTGEPVDLADIAAQAVASMRVVADDQGIDLTARSGSGQMTVRASTSALRRAVTALLDNALAHTPVGGQITVAVSREAAQVVLTVTDTGAGIADQDPDRLTERFARGTAGPGGARRFGLGLSLVREIAASHGGTFTLTNGPAGGGVATLRLPPID